MPKIPGKNMLLKSGDDKASPAVWTTVAQTTSHTLDVSTTKVEENTKDSAGWRETSDEGGIKSVNVSMDGVYAEDATQDELITLAMGAAVQWPFQLHLNDGSGLVFEGLFSVDISFQGETEGNETFSATLESSGTITVT